MFATLQIKESTDPWKEHGKGTVYLTKYLKQTRDLGLEFKPNQDKDLIASVMQTSQENGANY